MKTAWMVGVVLLAIGCSKDDPPPVTIPLDPTPVASVEEPHLEEPAEDDANPDASAAADDAAATTANPKPTPRSPAPGPRRRGESIASCCAALGAQARVESDASKKGRYKQASSTCYGIDKVVKAGRTSRAAALRQVRALAGSRVPGPCR